MSHNLGHTTAWEELSESQQWEIIAKQLKFLYKSSQLYDPETDPIFGPEGPEFNEEEYARDLEKKRRDEANEALRNQNKKLTRFHYLFRMMKRDFKHKFGRKDHIPNNQKAEEIRKVEADMEELGRRFKELEKDCVSQESIQDGKDETLSAATMLAQRESEVKKSMWARRWGNKDKEPEHRGKQ